jgi:type IV secretory pathway VirB2 component (pilin)
VLGLAGPLVFAGVSLLGLAGLAGRVSWIKLVVIFIGIILVLIGTSSK